MVSEHFPWADIVGKHFLFLRIYLFIYFRSRKKGRRHSRSFRYIFVKILHKRVVYLSSSHKNTQFEKTNRPKRSPEGKDIEVLKSAIIQGFFHIRRCDLFFVSVVYGGRIFSNKLYIWVPLTISPNFKKKISWNGVWKVKLWTF